MKQAPLAPEERKALRARGHALNPVVTLGERGLAESVVAELDVALNAHELIKVRLPAIERTERAALAEQVVKTTGAQQVQSIGRIILIYRQRPQEEKAATPYARPERASKKKVARRTRLR